MRGLGTIFRMRGSRFFWMQYFVSGERFRESTKCDRLKDAQQVLKNKLVEIQQNRHRKFRARDDRRSLYADRKRLHAERTQEPGSSESDLEESSLGLCPTIDAEALQ